jgi:predicted ATPase
LPQVFPASSDVPEQQEHLFRAVAELLRLGSTPRLGRKPHILLLEDLQWADEASLQLFLFMAHFIQPQSSQSPILLLGTLRSEEAADNPALQTLLHDAQREALAQRLTLPPLGKEEISSLIGVLWLNAPAETPIDEIRDNLLAAAGGNPLFVTEILRELTQTAVLPTPLPIPPSLQELTNRRLRQLPGSSRQVIETLAVFEQPTHFDLIQQVSGRTEDEAITAIELGLRWRFLEPRQASQYGFSHDLIGDAVRRQLSQIRRQRLHHRVADAGRHF